jgi:hypothetical protein
VAWARTFAAELPPNISVRPGVPHTNQFKLYAAGESDIVNKGVLTLMEKRHIGLPAWEATHQPGRISTEVIVSGAALGLDPAEMAALVSSAIKPDDG